MAPIVDILIVGGINMEPTRIKTNGTELAVFVHRMPRPGEDTILFLHPGGFFASYVWDDVIPQFTALYGALAVDLRGHGASEKTKNGYELPNMARDLVGVLDALGLERVHVVGNSLGSSVGIYLAALYPERVLSLVNVDNGMLDFIGEHGEKAVTKEDFLAGRSQPREFDSRQAFVEQMSMEWAPIDALTESVLQHVTLSALPSGRYIYQQPYEIDQQIMAAVCDGYRWGDVLPQVSCPMLFLPATEEPNFERKLARLREIAPQAAMKVIPGSKHLMMYHKRPELVREVQAFLAQQSQ